MRDRIESGLGARRQRDIGPGLGQPDRDRPPDPLARPGNHRDLAIEPEPVENTHGDRPCGRANWLLAG